MSQMPSMDAFQNSVQADRRSFDRTIAIFRPALVETEEMRTFFCLVRNISPSGLMASAFAPVAKGQLVRFIFSESFALHASVIWSQDDRVGVHFPQKVDVAAFLEELAGNSAGKADYRAPRLPISEYGHFLHYSMPKKIVLMDISQRGFKASAAAVSVGDRGSLVLPGLLPRQAVVRWSDGETAGFYFIEPIGFAELGQWILDRHNWGAERA